MNETPDASGIRGFVLLTTPTMKTSDTVELPLGFRAAGIAAGIKRSGKKDLALIASDLPATVAGVFTTNQVKAAPVKLGQQVVARGIARSIVINSGNANACTGARGMRDAKRMAALTARALGVRVEEVLVCSTGVIGKPMPMPLIAAGINRAASALHDGVALDAAEAIMTTDTRPKRATLKLKIGGKLVTLTAFAKGAGMIQPNMATMLCFILTDARVERSALKTALRAAASQSFNRITVDGDMSTNDTALLLANGAAGNATLKPGRPGWSSFTTALNEVTLLLAKKIARDGEGATKLVIVNVSGARNNEEADLAARCVANSLLVKTCWNGDYPNWGRIMDAIGYSKARIAEDRVEISYGKLVAVRNGVATNASIARLSAVQRKDPFEINIRLNIGSGNATIYTCDISEEYVRVNVDYVKLTTGKSPT